MAQVMGSGGFDLHTHSHFSDGTTSPAEIVLEATELGLSGIALTDHDTSDGWDEARAQAAESGLDFLPGMEITTRDGHRSIHLLAYGLDPAHPRLQRELDEVKSSRVHRARRMVELLAVEYRIAWADVIGDEDARTVGRPHIADALVTAGYFADRSTAFAEVLGPGSRYYLPTHAVDTTTAIRLVRDAGGVPVLAHPAAGRHRSPVERGALDRFTAAGLWGIELEHPENRPEWLPQLRIAAEELGLTATGASDYHGAGKPNRLGQCRSGPEVVAAIREIAAVPR